MRDYLNTLTVKTLGEILHQMGAKGWSGLRKAGLVDVIMVQIDVDHSEAMRMNTPQESEDVYMIAGIEFTGATASLLKSHDERVRRYNPTMARDKEGYVILTPKQRRRIAKKDRRTAKRLGMYA